MQKEEIVYMVLVRSNTDTIRVTTYYGKEFPFSDDMRNKLQEVDKSVIDIFADAYDNLSCG